MGKGVIKGGGVIKGQVRERCIFWRLPPADSKISKFCHNEIPQNTYKVSILTLLSQSQPIQPGKLINVYVISEYKYGSYTRRC